LKNPFSLPFVQWIWLAAGQNWVLMDKNDSRFIDASKKFKAEGDLSVPPTTIFTDRSKWKKAAVFQTLGTPFVERNGSVNRHKSSPFFMACDNVFGNRLVCLGRSLIPGKKVALMMGHESTEYSVLKDRRYDTSIYAKCGLEFLEYMPKEELKKHNDILCL